MDKTWLNITENNDHSYQRILMMAPAQFTWIFVGNRSHAYKMLWAPPVFFLF